MMRNSGRINAGTLHCRTALKTLRSGWRWWGGPGPGGREWGKVSRGGPFWPRKRGRPPLLGASASRSMMPSAKRALDVVSVIPAVSAGGTTQHRTVSPREAPLLAQEGKPGEVLHKGPSPIILSRLEEWLGRYPDRGIARFLGDGFSQGFRLPVFE